MTAELDAVRQHLDAARSAYEAAHARLSAVCHGLYVDGAEATDQLLSLADEIGAQETISRVLENAERFGPVNESTNGSVLSDLADTLEDALEATLVAQERVDQATARRENILRAAEPNRMQVINIAGREYVIDTSRNELRAVDNAAERYELGLDIAKRTDNAPSLTETAGGVAPARPVEQTPSRRPGRTR